MLQLYENYADPFNLWESKLEIIDCSNTPAQDSDIINEIWENIVAEGECVLGYVFIWFWDVLY